MTSKLIPGACIPRAIYNGAVVPEGQAVGTVLVKYWKLSKSENLPAIVIRRHYQIPAADCPSQASEGMLARLRRNSLAASLASPHREGRAIPPVSMNFCRTLSGWSIRAPFQAAKQAARCFTDRLAFVQSRAPVAVSHGKQRNGASLSWATNVMSRVTKCL